ncbi:MAG: flagellar basal body P-ring protein FlgI [Pirellulales bacterium]
MKSNTHFRWNLCAGLLSIVLTSIVASMGFAQEPQVREESYPFIGDICRLKGQEVNELTAYGLVVGLKGSGDGDGPTTRSLAAAMQKMGAQLGVDLKGQLQTKELKDAKNVASVFVTVRIPERGAQQGDRLDCTVSAISAKSLEGGTLLLAPLVGPRVDQPVVYGLASGQLMIPDPKVPTSAKISGGCKMEMTVRNEFVYKDTLTLVLHPGHSSFETAETIADVINSFHSKPSAGNNSLRPQNIGEHIAVPIDQAHVEVKIPANYRDNPVPFVAQILRLQLANLKNRKRVVIQERSGVILVGEEVTIDPVAINHKNLTISTKASESFIGVDSLSGSGVSLARPKLKHLVDALKSISVPTEDMISIIKALKQQGNLYGELVID